MHGVVCVGVGALCKALLGVAAAAPAGPADSLVVEWRPPRPVQGSLVIIAVTPAAGATLAGLRGTLAGEPLHFEPDGAGGMRALGAIPLGAEDSVAGVVETDGTSRPFVLPVRPRVGRNERLRTADRFVQPPDSALEVRLAAERAATRAVMTATHQRARLWTAPFGRPRPGVVRSAFGTARVFNGVVQSRHRGTDLAGRRGDPVRAAARGIVALVAEHYYAGNSVWLDHGAGLLTAYLHLDTAFVAVGDTVEPGRVLGRVGATGRVTAPHLHWSAAYGGIAVDPMDLLGPVVGELDAVAVRASPLAGAWRLDSLGIAFAGDTAASDSTRAVYERYVAQLAGATAQFRAGAMAIVTTYEADASYAHVVRRRGAPAPDYAERGRWALDSAGRRLTCTATTGRHCPHHGAVVVRVTPDELILELALTGHAAGLHEYFRLVRVMP
jgi:hypothetical protein